MATQPSKPTRINVKQLQSVVNDLTALKELTDNPPPGSFTAITGEIKTSLGTQVSDNGLNNIAGIDDVDKRYQDASQTVAKVWPQVTEGIGALITMLTDTINKHTTADGHAAQGANDTNTGTAATGGRASH